MTTTTPAATTTTLSDDQLGRYHRDGYLLVPEVFPVEELRDLDRHLDEVQANRGQESRHRGPAPDWLMALGLASERCAAFCADPRLLDLVDAIVYPGIAIYSAKLVSKEPHDQRICHWHQDEAYYAQRSRSRCRMSAWVPLQDVAEGQGCLQVVPGSHRLGLRPAAERTGGTCTRGLRAAVDPAMAVALPVPAGSVVLFDSHLWHHSGGNDTAQRRRAFIISYQEATVPRGNGDQWRILRPTDADARHALHEQAD